MFLFAANQYIIAQGLINYASFYFSCQQCTLTPSEKQKIIFRQTKKLSIFKQTVFCAMLSQNRFKERRHYAVSTFISVIELHVK